MIYHLPSDTKKKKRGWKQQRERDSVCWCNHRHKVSMSKRWNKKEKRASMCIIHKRISLLAAGLSPSCSRFFFLGPTKNININFTCPHTHPKKVGNHFLVFFHGLRQSKDYARNGNSIRKKRKTKNDNWIFFKGHRINIVTNFWSISQSRHIF